MALITGQALAIPALGAVANIFFSNNILSRNSQLLGRRSNPFGSLQDFKRPRIGVKSAASTSRSATMVITKRKRRTYRRTNIGRLAYKKVRRLERQQEVKAHFSTEADISLPGTGTAPQMIVRRALTSIGNGTGTNGRIGSKVSPRQLNVNLCLRNTDSDPHCVRVLIIQAMSQKNPQDYFDDHGTGSFRFLNPKGIVSRFEFRTLYDNIIALSAGTTNNFPVMARLTGARQVEYDKSTTAASRGEIYLMLIRDTGGTAAHVQCTYSSRLTFTDA